MSTELIHRSHKSILAFSSATYSPCEQYRYILLREWSVSPKVNFIMLNPSTATEQQNDATVERCQRRAEMLGFGGLMVTNLFAYRATDPKDMKRQADPVGPDNDEVIIAAADDADMVICAWGGHGNHLGRAGKVLEMLRGHQRISCKLHALKTTNGQPWHPLYLPYRLQPRPF